MAEHSKYTIMGLNGLVGKLNEFPELEDVVRRLINLKFACPYMSDEERLLSCLRNVKSNRDKPVVNNYFDKELLNGKRLNYMNLSEIYNVKRR